MKVLKLILALVAVGALVEFAGARLTGTNPTGALADRFCVGSSGSEACVTSTGGVAPTTTAVSPLGTAALLWSNVYAVVGTITSMVSTTVTSTNYVETLASPGSGACTNGTYHFGTDGLYLCTGSVWTKAMAGATQVTWTAY